MSYLQNISRASGNRLGGVLNIQVMRVADVLQIARPRSGTVYTSLVLKPGGQIFNWQVAFKSIGINTKGVLTDAGPTNESSLEFLLIGDTPEIRNMLELASNDEFIVLFKYPSERWKIFGQLNRPVRFSYDHSSGMDTSERNGSACRFYYQGPNNIFFYEGTVPSPPTGVAPCIVRFNGQAIASLLPGETLNITSDYSFSQYFSTTQS